MKILHQQIALDDLNKEHWFNWQQPSCALLLGGCFEACGERFKATFGIPFFTSILYFRPLQGGDSSTMQGSWLLRLDEGTNCGTYLIDLLQLESFRRAVSTEFDSVSAELSGLSAKIKDEQSVLQENLPSLGALAGQFFAKFWRFYTLGAITEPVQWRVEAIVKRDLIGSKVGFTAGVKAKEWEGGKILGAAFATGTEPYALEILDDFGRLTTVADKLIAQEASLAKRWSFKFTKADAGAIDEGVASKALSGNGAFVDLMDQHLAKYYWKQSNYLRAVDYGRPECLEEVLRALRSAKTENFKDPKTQAEEAHRTRENLLEARAELLSSISDYHRTLIVLGDEFGSGMADRRKRTMLQALAALEILAQKLSRASGLDRSEIGMLMPEELDGFCAHPEQYADRLRMRREGFLLIESPFPLLSSEFNAMAEVQEGKGPALVPLRQGATYVETAQIASTFEELNSNLRITYPKGDQTVLSGDVAFSDSHKSISGRARIVRDPAVDRFEAGEILVATSTTPDFMPQIRIAKAIVTDQGGMATHAALTSRELKIPCIVGTAIGSLKIKSGDALELDLQTGHVKIIK